MEASEDAFMAFHFMSCKRIHDDNDNGMWARTGLKRGYTTSHLIDLLKHNKLISLLICFKTTLAKGCVGAKNKN